MGIRRWLTASSVVVVILAFTATSASAAKPAPAAFSATLAITSTDTSTNTCSGTLTVSWQGKGIDSLSWSADASDTGTLSFLFGGARFSKAQKSVTETVPFTLTAGTGKAVATASGTGFIARTT